jgi:hypothetical protein
MECKNGCCQMTGTGKTLSIFGKIKAHIKGDILGRVITYHEYYYLMFGLDTYEKIRELQADGEEMKQYVGIKDNEKWDNYYKKWGIKYD